jgi:hypothetical protein
MFVGDCGVGKTAIIDSFVNDERIGKLEMTNAVDIFFKRIKLKDGILVNVNIAYCSLICGIFRGGMTLVG